jgi:UDP-glucose 4-epimerase
MKTILVTGGAGFIGFHLIKALISEPNNQVISIDNYFTGSKDNHIPGVTYLNGHTQNVASVLDQGIDEIFHLGEYSRVGASIDEPDVVWNLNILGTLGVLDLWRRSKCKLLYAGSSTKFSRPLLGGFDPKNLSPYTWSKACNSELIQNYGRWYDLRYTIVYLHNVYGPRELSGRYGTLIGTLRQSFIDNKPLHITSPGSQRRCFTHVDDTVRGIVLASQQPDSEEYEIGIRRSYSLLEVAELFEHPIVLTPQVSTGRSTIMADSEKIEALGWRPIDRLESYIQDIKKAASVD